MRHAAEVRHRRIRKLRVWHVDRRQIEAAHQSRAQIDTFHGTFNDPLDPDPFTHPKTLLANIHDTRDQVLQQILGSECDRCSHYAHSR